MFSSTGIRRIRLRVALVTVAVAVLTACGADGGTPAAGPSPSASMSLRPADQSLNVQVASYDLATGDESRVIVGVLTPDNQVVVGGQVATQFFYLGPDGQATPEPGPRATGTFLPVPGKAPDPIPGEPTVGAFTDGIGVYEMRTSFDRSGAWGIAVRAQLADGTTRTGSTRFEVAEEHQVPAVGEQAPAVDNHTMSSGGPEVAIDSRAVTEGEIPDPQLHETTVAQTIEQGRPSLVVFSTPVYCVSKFCGPVTETVEQLADEYGDRAAFIHIEIWRDFNGEEANPAAAEWLRTPDGGLTEPWVFLIGADGTIQARWDNVPDRDAIVATLEALPTSGDGS